MTVCRCGPIYYWPYFNWWGGGNRTLLQDQGSPYQVFVSLEVLHLATLTKGYSWSNVKDAIFKMFTCQTLLRRVFSVARCQFNVVAQN